MIACTYQMDYLSDCGSCVLNDAPNLPVKNYKPRGGVEVRSTVFSVKAKFGASRTRVKLNYKDCVCPILNLCFQYGELFVFIHKKVKDPKDKKSVLVQVTGASLALQYAILY